MIWMLIIIELFNDLIRQIFRVNLYFNLYILLQVIEMEKLGGSELLQRQLDDSRVRQDELESTNQNKDAVRLFPF